MAEMEGERGVLADSITLTCTSIIGVTESSRIMGCNGRARIHYSQLARRWLNNGGVECHGAEANRGQ